MAYRDPKTGQVFQELDPDRCYFHGDCAECPTAPYKTCYELIKNDPYGAAALFGFEMVPDDPNDVNKPDDTKIVYNGKTAADLTPQETEEWCMGISEAPELTVPKVPDSNLARILGVREDEEWHFLGGLPLNDSVFRIHDGVRQHKIGNIWYDCGNEAFLADMIAHPDRIMHIPHLTEAELSILKASKAKWVTKDKTEGWVHLWRDAEPKYNANGGIFEGIYFATFVPDVFSSIHRGDCIRVREVLPDE